MFFKKEKTVFNLKEVLDGCRQKHPSSQKKFFDYYVKTAKNICLRYTSSEAEAEEVMSDGFLKFFEKVNLYDQNLPFDSWFRKLMVNNAIDYYRKMQKGISFIDIEDVKDLKENEREEENFNDISADEIMMIVQKLSPAYRTIFSLHAVEGYSHSEIANLLGITESACRANLYKARVRLKEWIISYIEAKKLY